MSEVESNRHAWGMLAEDHYRHYRKRIEDGENRLNAHIREELGDLAGKRVAHLQCNVGFDTLALAERAAHVTGAVSYTHLAWRQPRPGTAAARRPPSTCSSRSGSRRCV